VSPKIKRTNIKESNRYITRAAKMKGLSNLYPESDPLHIHTDGSLIGKFGSVEARIVTNFLVPVTWKKSYTFC
jgi:hypothetical protein